METKELGPPQCLLQHQGANSGWCLHCFPVAHNRSRFLHNCHPTLFVSSICNYGRLSLLDIHHWTRPQVFPARTHICEQQGRYLLCQDLHAWICHPFGNTCTSLDLCMSRCAGPQTNRRCKHLRPWWVQCSSMRQPGLPPGMLLQDLTIAPLPGIAKTLQPCCVTIKQQFVQGRIRAKIA